MLGLYSATSEHGDCLASVQAAIKEERLCLPDLSHLSDDLMCITRERLRTANPWSSSVQTGLRKGLMLHHVHRSSSCNGAARERSTSKRQQKKEASSTKTHREHNCIKESQSLDLLLG